MKRLFDTMTQEEKSSWILFIGSFIVYAVISMTKSAYAASMASIVGEGLFNKSQAGTINASFYLFYGIAQILGVKIVDKFSPIRLITMTLIGTLISTVGMAVSKNFMSMLLFWSFCGLIQFAIWPSILRIISEYLVPYQAGKAMVYIAFSYCIGMLVNYLAAWVVLGFAHWTMLFWVFSAILVLSIVLWAYITNKTRKDYKKQVILNRQMNEKFMEAHGKSKGETEKVHLGKILITSGVLILLVPALIRTALDTGLKSWVPTMITESYSVSASFASMLTTILVFTNLSGVFIVTYLYPRYIKNSVWAYALCFLSALPFTILLLLTGKIPVLFVVIFLAAVTTLMYAGHQLINVIIPSFFTRYNKAGSVAAILNAIASFGAVLANIGFGYLAEQFGWSKTIVSWIILSLIAFLLCAAATPVWNKFIHR